MTMDADLDFLGVPDSSNIFLNSINFIEYSQKLRPIKPAIDFQGAGIQCEVKRLDTVYNGKGEKVSLSSGSRFRLEHDRPKDTFKAALVRTQHWTRSGEPDFVELEIRSPYMKAALKQVVPEYHDAVIDSNYIVIRDEPRCLFHYRNELFNYGAGLLPNSDEQKHVSFLLEYMNTELSDEIYSWTLMVDLEDHPWSLNGPSLEFQNLWMVFIPGEQIFVPKENSASASMVLEFDSMALSCRCQRPYCIPTHKWTITAVCIDHDSTQYGYLRLYSRINHYPGYMPLKHLKILPLRLHPDAQNIRQVHLARGQKFTQLQGKHHRAHKGVASMLGRERDFTFMGEEDSFPMQATWINGRVVIDPETFVEARPAHAANLYHTQRRFRKPRAAPEDFTEDELIICHYQLPGFALSEKQWGWFSVDNISEIDYDSEAFTTSLILQPRVKNMVLSLVQVHDKEQVGFDDVITGKGRGMIFLLHGEPGVGKTLTAESVADYCRKPLLRIDASMLGITADSVETQLAASFHLAEKWNCVILIDEADVFLDRRTSSDLARNSLVAVFLRVLEYYQGILFLTTNRLETFDPAFKSRVHLAIYYPKLAKESRASIWRTFLGKVSQEFLQEISASGALEKFASKDINGRQIKNVVRMAQARAVSDGEKVSEKYVEEALDAMDDFDHVRELDDNVRSRRRRRQDSDTEDDSDSLWGTKRPRVDSYMRED
ncbi:P-loop containing nucleoside triphosphate hydrolase protein [Naviculisporaceae sp. PSN 640]